MSGDEEGRLRNSEVSTKNGDFPWNGVYEILERSVFMPSAAFIYWYPKCLRLEW